MPPQDLITSLLDEQMDTTIVKYNIHICIYNIVGHSETTRNVHAATVKMQRTTVCERKPKKKKQTERKTYKQTLFHELIPAGLLSLHNRFVSFRRHLCTSESVNGTLSDFM